MTFVAFDILALNGRDLLDYVLTSRREVLDCLVRLSDGALTPWRRSTARLSMMCWWAVSYSR